MFATAITTQIADAAQAVFEAEAAAKVARAECESRVPFYSWSPETPEFLDARERLKAANWALAQARCRRDDLIRQMEFV